MASKDPAPARSASPHDDALERTLAELREANERLLIMGVRMQELAEAADQARKDAEAANRAKDEFLAILGHELRNPLAPIQTALALMRLRGDTTAERERTVIERQVRHLTRLVDDLLDVSRITRGMDVITRERLNVADVIAQSIETASPLLEQWRHTLQVDVPRHGLHVEGDRGRLSQVVANALTNAAKYTEPGGTVTIRAESVPGEIVVSVRDTGRGISPEMLPYVFDPFVQERQQLDRSRGGLGLGLAIVRSIVTMHGGTVALYSEGQGRGSEFVVRLPAAPTLMANGEAETTAGPAPRSVTTEGFRVLVVDDNEDAADLLAAALRFQGHDTRVARDGPGALRIWGDDFTPQVVLIDIGLPVMDGYELAERLRQRPGGDQLRLVALTGYGQASDRQRAHAAGFDAHLVKPVDLDTLNRALREPTPPG
jgi:signal transduction histidine kinase/ActR/RegA family two-component response regulator